MEPNSPSTPVMPSPAPRKWWQRSRKTYIIVGIVVLGVIIAAVALMSGGQDEPSTTNSTNSSLYYERPGYERSEIGTGVGDAQAIVLKDVNAKPVAYQGRAVVQACSVLTMDNVRDAGLRTRAFQLDGAFSRDYFDGQGAGVLDPSTAVLESKSDDSNLCTYELEEGLVDLEVYQPPYTLLKTVDYEISRNYQAIPAIGGLQSYKRTSDTFTYYILRSGDTSIELSSSDISDAAVQKLLETAVANLKQQMANPDGPLQLAYDSPLLKKGYVIACDLLTASDVKNFFGAEASPVAKQTSANSVGVLKFNEQLADNYIQNGCERHSVKTETEVLSFSRSSIKLTAETFTKEEAAKAQMNETKNFNGNATAVSGLGDEAFMTLSRANTESMFVRTGRVVLEFEVDQPKQPPPKPTIDALTAIAKPVVARVKL